MYHPILSLSIIAYKQGFMLPWVQRKVSEMKNRKMVVRVFALLLALIMLASMLPSLIQWF
jgi:hypothetical protein